MNESKSGTICQNIECGHVQRGGSWVAPCPRCGDEMAVVDDVVTPPDCPPWCQHSEIEDRKAHHRVVAADLIGPQLLEVALTLDGDAHGAHQPPRLRVEGLVLEELSLDEVERVGRTLLAAVDRGRDLTGRG